MATFDAPDNPVSCTLNVEELSLVNVNVLLLDSYDAVDVEVLVGVPWVSTYALIASEVAKVVELDPKSVLACITPVSYTHLTLPTIYSV